MFIYTCGVSLYSYEEEYRFVLIYTLKYTCSTIIIMKHNIINLYLKIRMQCMCNRQTVIVCMPFVYKYNIIVGEQAVSLVFDQ